jgi:hypothetical protein
MTDRETALPIAAVVILGLVAGVLAATVDNGALRVLFGAIVVVATAIGSLRAGGTAGARIAGTGLRVVQPEADLRFIRQDRRNPIFDRSTGLFADWYVRLRLEEEISRSARFGQRFSVVTITSPEGISKDLALTLARALRHVDYAADLGPAVAVVLPNTDEDGAEIWRDRLNLPASCDSRISEYPKDGKTVGDLLGESQWAWPSQEFGAEAV